MTSINLYKDGDRFSFVHFFYSTFPLSIFVVGYNSVFPILIFLRFQMIYRIFYSVFFPISNDLSARLSVGALPSYFFAAVPFRSPALHQHSSCFSPDDESALVSGD